MIVMFHKTVLTELIEECIQWNDKEIHITFFSSDLWALFQLQNNFPL